MTGARELARTEVHIAEAIAQGAQVLAGGQRRPDLGPRFFEPTVVVNADHSMRIMQEETFGPVLAVMKVRDANEAVALANDSEYGLSATIYTRNLKRGEALAERLHCGDAGINQPQLIFGTPSLPMGGVKSSGVGRRGGREGLMRFVRPQSILTDRLIGVRPELAQADHTTRQLYSLLRRARRVAPWL
jgi:succinate-semialdehyde dehydrogenase/glutarate-semialdehyde dehydrogenase